MTLWGKIKAWLWERADGRLFDTIETTLRAEVSAMGTMQRVREQLTPPTPSDGFAPAPPMLPPRRPPDLNRVVELARVLDMTVDYMARERLFQVRSAAFPDGVVFTRMPDVEDYLTNLLQERYRSDYASLSVEAVELAVAPRNNTPMGEPVTTLTRMTLDAPQGFDIVVAQDRFLNQVVDSYRMRESTVDTSPPPAPKDHALTVKKRMLDLD